MQLMILFLLCVSCLSIIYLLFLMYTSHLQQQKQEWQERRTLKRDKGELLDLQLQLKNEQLSHITSGRYGVVRRIGVGFVRCGMKLGGVVGVGFVRCGMKSRNEN